MTSPTIVDPSVSFVGTSIIHPGDAITKPGNVLEATRDAYTQAAKALEAAGRTAVIVEVTVRVAPLA